MRMNKLNYLQGSVFVIQGESVSLILENSDLLGESTLSLGGLWGDLESFALLNLFGWTSGGSRFL
jgi:hypothetical protein